MKYLIAIDTTVCLKFPLGFQLGVLWRVLLLVWQFPSHYLWVSSANFYFVCGIIRVICWNELELFDTKNTPRMRNRFYCFWWAFWISMVRFFFLNDFFDRYLKKVWLFKNIVCLQVTYCLFVCKFRKRKVPEITEKMERLLVCWKQRT